MLDEEQRLLHRLRAEQNGNLKRWIPEDPELQQPGSFRGFQIGIVLGLVAWHGAGLFLWWFLSR